MDMNIAIRSPKPGFKWVSDREIVLEYEKEDYRERASDRGWGLSKEIFYSPTHRPAKFSAAKEHLVMFQNDALQGQPGL